MVNKWGEKVSGGCVWWGDCLESVGGLARIQLETVGDKMLSVFDVCAEEFKWLVAKSSEVHLMN